MLPIMGSPLEDGWVAVDDGRVVALGRERRRVPRRESAEVDLGRAVLLPGLVNAHTHLELSYLADAVPPAPEFTGWIRRVMALRREQPDPAAPVILEALRAEIASLQRLGTALVGDVSNTLVSLPELGEAGLPAAVFYELVRFRAADGEAVLAAALRRLTEATVPPGVHVSIAPHAPYSVSQRLFEAIRQELDRDAAARTTVHLAESVAELELLGGGSGPWRELLQDLGAWDESWTPPGCGPVEYLDRMRFLSDRVLVVHGVQLSGADLAVVRARGATLVTCPRSNRYVGAGDPPIERFYESGVAVAIGTDSRASASDLSIWSELAAMRALAPAVPASRLIESATRVGAHALGFGADLGTIEPGKRALLVAVAVPQGIDDIAGVEEYLVSGISPEHVRWAGDLA